MLARSLNPLREFAIRRQADNRDGKTALHEVLRDDTKRFDRPRSDRKQTGTRAQEDQRAIGDRGVALIEGIARGVKFARPEEQRRQVKRRLAHEPFCRWYVR